MAPIKFLTSFCDYFN